MKTALHILMKFVLWTLATAMVLIAIVYAINSHDERLSPHAISLLKAPPNPYSPGDNLYFMLAGLHAPPGTSVIAAGQAAVHAYETKLSTAPESFITAPDKHAPGILVFKGKLPACLRKTSTLWKKVGEYKAQIAQLLAANQVLYQRYRALHRATGYYDTETPSLWAMPAYASIPLRRLFLASFAVRMQTEDTAQQSAALTDMTDDLQVWRTALNGYGSLISKMLAIAYLRQDFELIGHMVADPSIVLSTRRAAVNRLVAPFPTTVWKMGSAFSYEYRWMTRAMFSVSGGVRQIDAKESFRDRVENGLLNHFVKKNATENRWAISTLRIISIVDGPPRMLEKSWKELADKSDCPATLKVTCLYNPIGKSGVLSMVKTPYLMYVLRAYDAAALQRMVKLAYEIRERRIGTEDVERFMKRHPRWSTQPVNGKAFTFNAVKRQLSVERFWTLPEIRYFTLPVWTRTASGICHALARCPR